MQRCKMQPTLHATPFTSQDPSRTIHNPTLPNTRPQMSLAAFLLSRVAPLLPSADLFSIARRELYGITCRIPHACNEVYEIDGQKREKEKAYRITDQRRAFP